MIALKGGIDSLDMVHDAVRRMEDGAAQSYDQLAAAAEALASQDAATTFRSLAAAARRRARIYAGSVSPAPTGKPELSLAPPEGIEVDSWRVLEIAQDMEYSMLTLLEVVEAIGETDDIRAEAAKLAERKRLHLAELASRQSRYPAPPGIGD